MKLGYTVGIVLGIIVVLLVLLTGLLPDTAAREGEARFCADRETVFAHFHQPERITAWSSIFGSVEPDEVELIGDSGEASGLRLTDDQRWLQLEVVDSQAPEFLRYQFSTHDGLSVAADISLQAQDSDTAASVTMEQQFSTYFGRWARFFVGGVFADLMQEEFEGIHQVLAEAGHECPAS
ncbi:SRPBCC family protein [Gammaproteobacteria bacterium AB-CW1]|uniref:SRPBCC family protein n=1 Tax=Natronospira elongata TaxID=3110268 RepID=A0AAP6MLB6_9GAMM|nr:SRPBCC family protein [Gammaproteobacteria bacterium AB-CW1]